MNLVTPWKPSSRVCNVDAAYAVRLLRFNLLRSVCGDWYCWWCTSNHVSLGESMGRGKPGDQAFPRRILFGD